MLVCVVCVVISESADAAGPCESVRKDANQILPVCLHISRCSRCGQTRTRPYAYGAGQVLGVLCKPQLARVCPALFALRSSHPHHSLWHCRRLACGLSCHLATKLRSRSPEDSPSRSLHKACPFLYIPPSNVQPIAKPTGTMYPLGFLPFFYSLVPDSVAVGAAAAVPLLALALWLYGVLPRSPSSSSLTPGDDDDDDAPVHLPGSSLSHILPFFRHRFDFLNEGFQLAGQAIYQFSLLRVRVRHGHCARLGQRGGIPHRARRGGRRSQQYG